MIDASATRKTLESVHPEPWVDHCAAGRVGAHRAGAALVIDRCGRLADEGFQCAAIHHVAARRQFPSSIARQFRARGNGPHDRDGIQHFVHVCGGRVVACMQFGAILRIGGADMQPTPAFRMAVRHPDHEAGEGIRHGQPPPSRCGARVGQGREIELQVGACPSGVAPHETTGLIYAQAQRPVARHQPGQPGPSPRPERAERGIERRDCRLEDQVVADVVLQVVPDRRGRADHVDPKRPETVRVADTRQLQKLRRTYGARGQDHLAARHHPSQPPAAQKLDPHRAAALEQDARRRRVPQQPQVRAAQGRGQIAGRRRGSPSVPHRDLVDADAFLVGPVEVEIARMALCRACRDKGMGQGMRGTGHVADVDRTRPAAPPVLAARPCLQSAEGGQNVGIGPPGAARCGPAIVIGRMPAHEDHRIDRRGASDHAPARPIGSPSPEPGIRFRIITPVQLRMIECPAITDRHVDPQAAVRSACLENGHVQIGPIRQTRGQHASRRSRAHNHDIGHVTIASGHRNLPSAALPR